MMAIIENSAASVTRSKVQLAKKLNLESLSMSLDSQNCPYEPHHIPKIVYIKVMIFPKLPMSMPYA